MFRDSDLSNISQPVVGIFEKSFDSVATLQLHHLSQTSNSAHSSKFATCTLNPPSRTPRLVSRPIAITPRMATSPFAGRLILVTGATSGIGGATARAFARVGGKVVATGRNVDALGSLEAELKGEGQDITCIAGDVTDDAAVKNVVDKAAALSSDGKIDVLVNCAGVLQGGATGAATMANWDFNMNVNGRAVFCFMTNATPYLKRDAEENGAKSAFSTAAVVNVSSVNGLQSFGGVSSYCCSKAAVDMLTDCAAVDLATFQIRVNSVNPGVVITELQKRGGMDEATYQAFLKRSVEVTHPLGRAGRPEEVADAIMFLADPTKAGFITGTHLTVDGGRKCIGAR
jgi:NAD(P)-dependent dehydrogenase (short-subunit alcohol dehydrogenase family)